MSRPPAHEPSPRNDPQYAQMLRPHDMIRRVTPQVLQVPVQHSYSAMMPPAAPAPSQSPKHAQKSPSPTQKTINPKTVLVSGMPNEKEDDLWKLMFKRLKAPEGESLKNINHHDNGNCLLTFESEVTAKLFIEHYNGKPYPFDSRYQMRMSYGEFSIERQIPNKKKLRITGLSADWTAEVIYKHLLGSSPMVKKGVEGVKPKLDKRTGHCQVIVDYTSEAACQEAIDRCQANYAGTTLEASHLLVPASSLLPSRTKLVIKGLPKDATNEEVVRYLFMNDPALIVESVTVFRKMCVAEFKTAEAAKNMFHDIDNKQYRGQGAALQVEWFKPN
ncbi:unnamed protein product, partial [Mesorhabditis spiculigera]